MEYGPGKNPEKVAHKRTESYDALDTESYDALDRREQKKRSNQKGKKPQET